MTLVLTETAKHQARGWLHLIPEGRPRPILYSNGSSQPSDGKFLESTCLLNDTRIICDNTFKYNLEVNVDTSLKTEKKTTSAVCCVEAPRVFPCIVANTRTYSPVRIVKQMKFHSELEAIRSWALFFSNSPYVRFGSQIWSLAEWGYGAWNHGGIKVSGQSGPHFESRVF
jgi:hypothetical protein